MKNKWSIDSLRIRIPMSNCKIIDEDLNVLFHTINSNTGEILETKLNSKSFRNEKGISTHFHLTKEYNSNNTLENHVVILVNSKTLKENYFLGINESTLKEVYKYLIDLNVVSFSFEAFEQAQCTDIDIKKDIDCQREVMLKAFEVIKQNAKAHKEKNVGLNKVNDRMLSFNDRKNTNFTKAPFLKIYDKTRELTENSIDFNLHYIKKLPQNLWRIEYTIKNKKHLNKLEMPNTLGELTQLSNESFEAGYQTTLMACLNKRLKETRIKSTDIPPKDVPMINAIIRCLDRGDTWQLLKNDFLGSLQGSNRTKRSIYLQTLFEDYIKPIQRYSNYDKLDNVLTQIGYTF